MDPKHLDFPTDTDWEAADDAERTRWALTQLLAAVRLEDMRCDCGRRPDVSLRYLNCLRLADRALQGLSL